MPFYQYRKLRRGEKVVVGCDTSMGLNDYCCAQFLSRQELDIPLVFRAKCCGTEMVNKIFPVLEQISDKTGKNPLVAIERNNGGDRDIERLAHLNRNRKFDIYEMKKFGDIEEKTPTKLGWDTNSATRPIMLTALKEVIDHILIRIYDKITIEQMFSFVKVQTSTIMKAQAENNCYDDDVMALAIAWQLYLDVQSEVDEVGMSAAMEEHKRNIEKIEGTGAGY